MRYYSTFPSAIPHLWAGYSRVTRPSATVHLLNLPEGIINRFLVRLACVRHAASVRPEPGSNSRLSLLYIHSIKECYIRSFADVSSSASFFRIFVCKKLIDYTIAHLRSLINVEFFAIQKQVSKQIKNLKVIVSVFHTLSRTHTVHFSMYIPVSSTAISVYHIYSLLSTLFFNFF